MTVIDTSNHPSVVHGNSRYIAHGCRCDVCRDAHTAYALMYNKAVRKAAKWVRSAHPGVFDRFLSEAYNEAGLSRRPVGRPPEMGGPLDKGPRRLRLADIPDDDDGSES